MNRFFVLVLLLTLLLGGCVTVERLEDTVSSAEKLMTDTTAMATKAPEGGLLTQKEAEEIVLKHSGLSRDQVDRLRTDYELENGRHQYEVEFRQGRWEYTYEIDAETGEILGYGRET